MNAPKEALRSARRDAAATETVATAVEPQASHSVAPPVTRIDERTDAAARPSLDEILTGLEKREILAALQRANGRRTLAAKFLRISRSRLYRRMDALGIEISSADRPDAP